MKQPNFMQNCLYFTASNLSRRLEKLADQIYGVTGMAPAYTYLMLMIEANPHITMTELAYEFDYEQSTLSRMVQKLVQHGWVIKKRNGRQTTLEITVDAIEILPVMHRALDKYRHASDELMGGRQQKLAVANTMYQATRRVRRCDEKQQEEKIE